MKPTISKYSEDFENHINEIAELKAQNWDLGTDKFKRYIRWNYIERPHSKPPILYIARSGDEIIGIRGFYESNWRIGPVKLFSSLTPADFLIKHEYRNTGIYHQMLSHIDKDIEQSNYPYLFNFNATPVNLLGCLSTGWKSIGKINSINKRFDSRYVGFAKSVLRKAGIYSTAKSLAHKFYKTKNNSEILEKMHDSSSSKHISIKNSPIASEMSDLVNNSIQENKISLVRKEPYFNWRYSNPLSNYLFLYSYDESLNGYLVLQSQIDYSNQNFHLIELEGVNTSVKIELLTHLIETIPSGSVSVWENMLDDDTYEYLISLGFQRESENRGVKDTIQTILVKPLGDYGFEYEGMNLLDPEVWDLKMIYLHDF